MEFPDPVRFPRACRWVRALVVVAAVVAAAPVAARADILHLKNGGKLEGVIQGEEKGVVLLKTRFGMQRVKRIDIARIEKTETAQQIYERKRAELDDTDAGATFELAQWCRSRTLTRQYRELLVATIELDPEHAEAHQGLGHVLFENEWMTPDEKVERQRRNALAAKKARGLVQYEGQWVTKEERDARQKGLLLFEGEWMSPQRIAEEKGLIQDDDGSWVHRDTLLAREEIDALEKQLSVRLKLHDSDHTSVRSAMSKEHILEVSKMLEKGHEVFHRTFGIDRDLLKRRLLPVIELEDRRSFQQYIDYFAREQGMSEAWLKVAREAHGTYHFDPPLIADYKAGRTEQHLVNASVNKLGRILANLFYYNFNYLPAWFEEGMAVWLEVEVCGNCTTYYLGSPGTGSRGRYKQNRPDISKRFDPNKGWILHGEWVARLRDAVESGSDTPIHRLLWKEVSEFDSLEVAKCWSFVEYLIRRDPEVFVTFILEIRKTMPRYESSLTPRERSEIQRKAFETAYEMRLVELEDEWKVKALGAEVR